MLGAFRLLASTGVTGTLSATCGDHTQVTVSTRRLVVSTSTACPGSSLPTHPCASQSKISVSRGCNSKLAVTVCLANVHSCTVHVWITQFMAPITCLVEVPSGVLSGFKALTPEQCAAVSVDPPPVLTDWAAVYPQLTLQSALNYLPNQWERGHRTAHIVSLYTCEPLKLLVYSDPDFMLGHASSQEKASKLKAAYHSIQGPYNYPRDLREGLLMTSLGEAGLAACVLDAEDFELIVPHPLFNPTNLRAEVLFTFHQSDRWPLSVGQVKGLPIEPHVLQDLTLLGQELSKHSPMTSCRELQQIISSALEAAGAAMPHGLLV